MKAEFDDLHPWRFVMVLQLVGGGGGWGRIITFCLLQSFSHYVFSIAVLVMQHTRQTWCSYIIYRNHVIS